MNYHIAICDDNLIDLDYISSLVNDWANMTGNNVNIKNFPSAEVFLFYYADDKSFDILLLYIVCNRGYVTVIMQFVLLFLLFV